MRTLAVAFLFVCTTALAGWKTQPSVQDEYRTSAVVFVGTVISARDVPAPDDFVQGTFYTIRVCEIVKGCPERTVELYSENSSGRFPMDVDRQYLVFASVQTFEDIAGPCLAIDAAGHSETIKSAGEALKAVRKFKTQRLDLEAPVTP